MERKILITHSKYSLKFNYYAISSGVIYSETSNKILAPQLDKDGYEKVQLLSTDNKRHRYSIHRLILENFNPVIGMECLQVNHIDGNKRNNALSNLEWVTCIENIHHAMEHNLRSEINGGAKLTPQQVIEIYYRVNQNLETVRSIVQEFNVNEETIRRIKYKYSWKNILKNL